MPNILTENPLRKQRQCNQQIYQLCQAALSDFPACAPNKWDGECLPKGEDPGLTHGQLGGSNRGRQLATPGPTSPEPYALRATTAHRRKWEAHTRGLTSFFVFLAVHVPLTVVTSPVAEHRRRTRRLRGHGSQA